MLEKQKEREEFEQTLQGWEDELLEQPIKDYTRTMWEVRIITKYLRGNVEERIPRKDVSGTIQIRIISHVY